MTSSPTKPSMMNTRTWLFGSFLANSFALCLMAGCSGSTSQLGRVPNDGGGQQAFDANPVVDLPSSQGGTGGSGGIGASGGTTTSSLATTTGGATGTGGSTRLGGATGAGGSTAVGGATQTGGSTLSGGSAAAGGSIGAGGTTTVGTADGGATATGGGSATGGAFATGGASATGGAATGGATPTGGVTSTGGSTSDSACPTQVATNPRYDVDCSQVSAQCQLVTTVTGIGSVNYGCTCLGTLKWVCGSGSFPACPVGVITSPSSVVDCRSDGTATGDGECRVTVNGGATFACKCVSNKWACSQI